MNELICALAKGMIEGTFNSAVTVTRLRGDGTPTQTGSAIWLSGIEHVLSGYDHILIKILEKRG